MSEFLAMGGYAAYVWPAYALFFSVLAWDWCSPAVRRRRLTRQLRRRLARAHTRHARTAPVEAQS